MASNEDGLNSADTYTDMFWNIFNEIFSNPLNVILLAISAFLFYKIMTSRQTPRPQRVAEKEIPRMKKRDMTIKEMKKYDGTDEDGRVCIAVNGKIFDVTRGKQFYGPGGPYAVFAGRDASRALALFTVKESALKDEYDDLSDLTSAEMSRMQEWEMQFTEKYEIVGRLLRDGEVGTEYTDSEDDCSGNGGEEGGKDGETIPNKDEPVQKAE
ncbi:membrane-associated progesterone receptor component 1-like [Argonauta hians]